LGGDKVEKENLKEKGYIRELIPPSILKVTGDVKYISFHSEIYSLQFKPLNNDTIKTIYLELEEQKCLIETKPSSLLQIAKQIKNEEKYARINIIHPDSMVVEANPVGTPPYKILNLVPQPLLQFNPAYNVDLTLYSKKGKRKEIRAIYFTVPVTSKGYQLGIRFFSVSLSPKAVRSVYLYVVKNKSKLERTLTWLAQYALSSCNISEIENYYRIETQMSVC